MFNYNKTISHMQPRDKQQQYCTIGAISGLTGDDEVIDSTDWTIKSHHQTSASVSCNWAELTLHARPAARAPTRRRRRTSPLRSPLTTASLIYRHRSPNYYLFTSSADRSPTKTSSLLYVLIYVVGLCFMTNISGALTSQTQRLLPVSVSCRLVGFSAAPKI